MKLPANLLTALTCTLFLPTAIVVAAPQIDSLAIESGTQGALNNGDVVVLGGSEFISNKALEQLEAAPLLWDRTDVIYEKGVINTHYQSFSEGRAVERLSSDSASVWEKPSAGNGTYGPLTTNISKGNRAHRSDSDSAHYYVSGPQGFLGWPTVYGGLDTPPGSDFLYISWWFKPKYSPYSWTNFTASDISGAFKVGDKFTMEGTDVPITGEIIHIEGNYYSVALEAEARNYARYYAGKPSVGKLLVKNTGLSGGSPASVRFGEPYLTPGSNKFIRVWDTPDGSNVRLSWTNDQFYLGGAPYVNKIWPGVAGEWNHMELQMDYSAGMVKGWVNGALTYEIPLEGLSLRRSADASPSIGLLGFDGKNQFYQESDFGDIYFNNQLHRVMLADKATWSEVESSGSHTELQQPISWQQQIVKFKLYKGTFNTVSGLYLYIFDENGKPNETGFLLPGKAAPKAPQLL